jgi:hypothetical protein
MRWSGRKYCTEVVLPSMFSLKKKTPPIQRVVALAGEVRRSSWLYCLAWLNWKKSKPKLPKVCGPASMSSAFLYRLPSNAVMEVSLRDPMSWFTVSEAPLALTFSMGERRLALKVVVSAGSDLMPVRETQFEPRPTRASAHSSAALVVALPAAVCRPSIFHSLLVWSTSSACTFSNTFVALLGCQSHWKRAAVESRL